MDSRATQQCNIPPCLCSLLAATKPVQGFYWPENAIGPTGHSCTVAVPQSKHYTYFKIISSKDIFQQITKSNYIYIHHDKDVFNLPTAQSVKKACMPWDLISLVI